MINDQSVNDSTITLSAGRQAEFSILVSFFNKKTQTKPLNKQTTPSPSSPPPSQTTKTAKQTAKKHS